MLTFSGLSCTQGAQLEFKTIAQRTPLVLASIQGYTDIVSVLLRAGEQN